MLSFHKDFRISPRIVAESMFRNKISNWWRFLAFRLENDLPRPRFVGDQDTNADCCCPVSVDWRAKQACGSGEFGSC
jgi:hypothetical protein